MDYIFYRFRYREILCKSYENDEPYWTNRTIEEAFGKAYFYVWGRGDYGWRVTMMYYHYENGWLNAGDLWHIEESSDIVQVTPPEEEYVKNKLRIIIPAQDGRKTNKDYISIWYQYCLPSEPDSVNITGGKYTVQESAKNG